MLLDSLPRPAHRQQDEGVGEEDDGAGQDVAEEEEAYDVGHGETAVVRSKPVDAAGRAVGLETVLAPAGQRTCSEDGGVAPNPNHQHHGMPRGELVS